MIGERKTVDIGDILLSTLIDGTGDPVIFLHGWGGSAESFQLLWEALRRRGVAGQFIAFDLPGFGYTAPPPATWQLSDFVKCVVKYLNQQGIQHCRFIVHSFGGRIMTLFATQHPHRVDSIVYIAPAGIQRRSFRLQCIGSISHVVRRCSTFPLIRRVYPVLRRMVYRLLHTTEYLTAEGVMQQTYAQVITQDLTSYFSQLTVPVHIFWGTKDSYVPVKDGHYMHSVIPHSQLTIFRGGRHGIHKTHANDIATHIITWWDSL